jgi:hypothetical protein
MVPEISPIPGAIVTPSTRGGESLFPAVIIELDIIAAPALNPAISVLSSHFR